MVRELALFGGHLAVFVHSIKPTMRENLSGEICFIQMINGVLLIYSCIFGKEFWGIRIILFVMNKSFWYIKIMKLTFQELLPNQRNVKF